MGTRATYEIDGTVFYCHFDGYPQGAAARFAAMVDKLHEVTDYGTIRSNGGGMDYAFIRGADDAQPTTTHEAHGDAEYRYICYRTDCGVVLTVHARMGWNGSWHIIYSGALWSFINAFTPDLEKRACVVPLGHGCGTGTLVSVRQLRNLKDSAGVTEAFEKAARLVGCQAALDQIRYAIKQSGYERGDELSGNVMRGGLLTAAE